MYAVFSAILRRLHRGIRVLSTSTAAYIQTLAFTARGLWLVHPWVHPTNVLAVVFPGSPSRQATLISLQLYTVTYCARLRSTPPYRLRSTPPYRLRSTPLYRLRSTPLYRLRSTPPYWLRSTPPYRRRLVRNCFPAPGRGLPVST